MKRIFHLGPLTKLGILGVVLLTIPPYTSHKLQPLDKAMYGPFKSSHNRSMDNWMRSNPGKTITIHEIPGLVNEAHLASMILRNVLPDNDYEGVFSKKVSRKVNPNDCTDEPTFIIDENDAASFTSNDILLKLPIPVAVGGSARSNLRGFNVN